MSFYVTLPSNSSQADFPENSLTHYTTRLKNPLRLNGNYEVALAQILFPKNWNYREDSRIRILSPAGEHVVTIKFVVWETLDELINTFNKNTVNTKTGIEMKYDINTSRIFLVVSPECKLIFDNGINTFFGFNKTVLEGTNKNYVFYSDEVVNSELNLIHSLYVYLDICKYQLVGDTEAPLLQVVSTNSVTDNYVEQIFDSPHYVPIARNNLETIEVDIRSDAGKPIQFHSGKVIVKLHFRKINYF